MTDTFKNALIGIGIVLAVILVIVVAQWNRIFPPQMSLTSSAFVQNGSIPADYTCDGKGVSPPLAVQNMPKDTKSLAFFVYDPDAHPGFTHWILFNVNPADASIPAGKIPDKSQQGLNSNGKVAYAPLCPPSGTHHYQFTAYALDQAFPFRNPPDNAALKNVMRWHVLASAQLFGTYSK